MSIAFANPLLLLGLAAGIIPILIHRLTHQRTQRRPFSAVRLLLHSQNVVARPQRLKHLLLLALRVAAVVAIVLMAARPTLVRPGLLAFGREGAKAVILDNSMSMGFTDGDGVRFEQAKKAAGAIIDHLAGPVAVIPTVSGQGGPSAERPAPLMRQREAAKELAALSLSAGRGDPEMALASAYRNLQTSKGRKEIVIISDMARGDWQRFDPAKLGVLPADSHLTFLRVGRSVRDDNAAIKGVSAGTGRVSTGSPFRLDVTVSNLSDVRRPLMLQILVDGVKVDQKPLELNAREEATAVFEVSSNQPGWRNGEARISGDGLAADDVFYFPFLVREKARIAVVDGDPRGSMRESESYYVTRALQPDDSGQSPFQVQVLHERQFSEVDTAVYDVLFLLNVRQPSPVKIAAFLDRGKTVFISLGDRVLVDEYNRIPLFPWRLRQVREAAERPERISRIDYGHAALAQFREVGGTAFSGAAFSRYYRVEGGTRPLLALSNGDPLLVESASGHGRLFLYASSADVDWNDLPLTAAYVPLVQGIVRGALGTMDSAIPPDVKAGDPFEETSAPVQVTGQQGGTGIYRFSPPRGEERRAVNAPFEESDLTKIAGPDLGRFFPGMGATMREYREDAAETLYGGRQDLWPYLLGFTLIVLAAEMGVAHRI